jgi:hypothetical protein
MAYGPVHTPSTQHQPENFLNDLSNSGPAIRLCDKGRATGARPKTVTGEVMTQYLVAIHHPDDYDPSVAEDEADGLAAMTDNRLASGQRPFQTISRATRYFFP